MHGTMNIKFVNTTGRSRDSSDGIQTRLWDRWRSNQRSTLSETTDLSLLQNVQTCTGANPGPRAPSSGTEQL